eukprot:1136949-Pelagomonas_calceolata.AAC.15
MSVFRGPEGQGLEFSSRANKHCQRKEQVAGQMPVLVWGLDLPLQELQGSLTKCVVQDGRTSELEKEVRKVGAAETTAVSLPLDCS